MKPLRIIIPVLILLLTALSANAQRCQGIKTNGTHCSLEAMPKSKFCKYHQIQDPNVRQCEGTTKKGVRCKQAAEKGSRYCLLHDPRSTKCKASTAKGTRCTKPAKTKGYCTQHYKMHQQGKI